MSENTNVTPLKAPPITGGDFEQLPVGVFVARCFRQVDIGTQQTTWKNTTKHVRQVILFFEILADDEDKPVRMSDGERVFTINKTYTFSMNAKANLRQDLDAWRGKPFTDEEAGEFDLTELLDKYCLLQVVHSESNGKTWANIGTIMTTKKSPDAVNEVASFSALAPNMEIFEALPDWIKDKVRAAGEWDEAYEKGGITPSGEARPNPEGMTQAEVDATPF